MKTALSILLLLGVAIRGIAQTPVILNSPDGKLELRVFCHATPEFELYSSSQLLSRGKADMVIRPFSGKSLPLKTIRWKQQQVREWIYPPVAEKRKIIPDHYSALTVELETRLSVEFRLYNDGMAYRFVSNYSDSIEVLNEPMSLYFPARHPVYYTAVEKRADQDSFHTSFEEPYQIKPIDSITDQTLIFSPLLLAPEIGPKILVTESDLEDYPGMFITGTNSLILKSRFAAYPLETTLTTGEFPQATVTRRAEYIARTRGSRSFPWRVLIVAFADENLPACDLVYRLGAPSRIENTSWIQPGKGTDEWIIGINLFNVPFKAGINTATYKYYIDFARRFGFDRIMMDAGWSDYQDLFKINPEINMEEIAAYAKSRNIKLSLWTLAHTLDRQLAPALEQFAKWGVDFIMTDFMDRDDQLMVNFYHRVAAATARHQIMVMFHGAFKPAGFSRTWPNAITREAVLGSEYNIWSEKASPDHNLLLPFIRMVAGPMDYEPGILDNANRQTFRPIGSKVMTQGTRCQQLAMFVVYDSPMQLFSGNPSQGYTEPAFMELLGSIPTTWDTTIILKAKLGEYLVTARRKGKDWFIGAINNWTAHTLNIDLSFLPDAAYTAIICQDGINADRYPSDYTLNRQYGFRPGQYQLKLASGGGQLIHLKPAE